jgi:hypothetical protein
MMLFMVSTKYLYKLFLASFFIFLIAITVSTYKSDYFKSLYKNLNNIINPSEQKIPSTSTTIQIQENNKTSVNEKINGISSGFVKESNKTKPVILKISNLCAAYRLFEGIILCSNTESPYYIILQESNNTISTSFYNETGFEQTLTFEPNMLLFNLYVEDLNTINLQNISISGEIAEYFSLGNYSVTSLQEINPQTGENKVIAVIPLYLNSIVHSSGWKNLSFYAQTPTDNYKIGDLWFYIIQS